MKNKGKANMCFLAGFLLGFIVGAFLACYGVVQLMKTHDYINGEIVERSSESSPVAGKTIQPPHESDVLAKLLLPAETKLICEQIGVDPGLVIQIVIDVDPDLCANAHIRFIANESTLSMP